MLSSESFSSGSSMGILGDFSREGGTGGGWVSLDLRRWGRRKDSGQQSGRVRRPHFEVQGHIVHAMLAQCLVYPTCR